MYKRQQAVTQGPPLSITGISVPAGGNATVIYEAALNEYAPLGIEAAVTNTATVSGTGITPVTAAETVNAEAAPNLATVSYTHLDVYKRQRQQIHS